MRNLKYYLPGSLLILISILIVVVPEILIAFVAASMIIMGVGALYFGHLARKSGKEWDVFNGGFLGDDLCGWRVLRNPGFGRWYWRS